MHFLVNRDLFDQIDLFCVFAEQEVLPENSDNLKTILSRLEKLETYQAKKRYAEKNLERLSSGSSRIVYLTPKKTVIKMAKNDRGIEQNKTEANPKMKSKYINKIISKAKDNSWIETYYLDKITEKEFKKMIGFDFKRFADCLIYGVKKTSDKIPKEFEKISKLEFYEEIVRIAKNFNLASGDLAKISSYGQKDDHLVLIDAGLTRDLYKKEYKSTTS